MPTIRATLFFEQQGYGWTESWWKTGVSSDLSAYDADTLLLAQKRILCSGENTKLTYYRLSAEGVFRDALVRPLPGGGLVGATGHKSDAPDTALLLRVRTADFAHAKNVFLRGVWDEVVTDGGIFVPTPAFNAQLNAYAAELVAKAWGWLGVTTRVTSFLTNAVQDPSGTVLGTLGAALFPGPFPQQATVNISGVKGATQLNGRPRVRATDATHFSTIDRISIFPYTTGGRVSFTSKALLPMAFFQATRIVERKAGRPSFLSPGRRAARRAG